MEDDWIVDLSSVGEINLFRRQKRPKNPVFPPIIVIRGLEDLASNVPIAGTRVPYVLESVKDGGLGHYVVADLNLGPVTPAASSAVIARITRYDPDTTHHWAVLGGIEELEDPV